MKVIKKVIIFIVLILVFIAALFTYQGYTLYKQALNEISVSDKVAEIKTQKNFI